MNPVYEKLINCYESIKDQVPFEPQVGLVLGSGLGGFVDSGQMTVEATINYKDIEGFPVSTAPGHVGRFVFGHVGEVPVVVMQGRVHYYEGYSMTDVVLPIRMMKLMGANQLFLTNAAGGIQRGLLPGTLMIIQDQITCFVDSPLIGENIPELGVRFPDMSEIYSRRLQRIAAKIALELSSNITSGVYLQLKGPNYETPAEISMARALGADAVGMSTGMEAVAANHMGMEIIGISCITNLAAGISPHKLTEEEVIETGKRVGKEFEALVAGIIKEM